MRLGIDPKVDYAFKKLFGQERTRPLLIHVLNAVFQFPRGEEIVAVELLNPFHPKETKAEKMCVLDIKARDAAGRLFNVEMQMVADPFFRKRLLYYWAKLHAGQMVEGDPYARLQPTYVVAFVASLVFADAPEHHLRFDVRERSRDLVFCDDLGMHILELSKFRKTMAELTTPLDSWLYFLKRGEDLETEGLPESLNFPEMQTAVKELTMITKDALELQIYEARMKMQHDIATREFVAREEGYEKGRATGREEGREQGKWIGAVQFLQKILRLPVSAEEELSRSTVPELQALAADLEARLPKTNGGN